MYFEDFFLYKFVRCDLGLACHLHAVFLFLQVTFMTESFCNFCTDFGNMDAGWML